ncbi:MAG TPA: RNA polymerase sigma factor [Phycisphaerae bacterium]|jgi:RNA polymerase sigma-70 factor (ECF subfamily)
MTATRERDEWLMAQVARGQRSQLEPLVRRYSGPLLTFIQRMVQDRHRGEELFQDVFVAVWSKRRQYQFPRPFKPWLYAIAINKCRGHLRTKVLPVAFSLDAGEHGWVPAGSGPLPGESAVATETAVHVLNAVAELPPRQRAVVVLRIWSELSYAEIADALASTEGTVRSHMHHGLAAMRRYLEPRLR